jgi:hypothetical protein
MTMNGFILLMSIVLVDPDDNINRPDANKK